MRTRVNKEEDYIEELAGAIEVALQQTPTGVLPWSWWREQAESYGVTPNNIYTRAISRGLYTPPSRRGERVEIKKRLQEDKTQRSSPARRTGSADRAPRPPSDPPGGSAASSAPPSSTRVISERLQAMADVAGVLGELERRITELENEIAAGENRRRETLRALDRLSRVLEEASSTVSALKHLYEPG